MIVNIKGLQKYEVLKALYDNAIPILSGGFGYLGTLGVQLFQNMKLTKEQAKEEIEQSNDLYFDYVQGKSLKIDLSTDEFDSHNYDRDYGEGKAKEIISNLYEELRNEKLVEELIQLIQNRGIYWCEDIAIFYNNKNISFGAPINVNAVRSVLDINKENIPILVCFDGPFFELFYYLDFKEEIKSFLKSHNACLVIQKEIGFSIHFNEVI